MTTPTKVSLPASLVACALAFAICAPAHATLSWNAGADFSASSNANGPWSYGTRATVGGASLSLLTDAVSGGPVSGWTDIPVAFAGTPFIGKNFSNSVYQSGTVTWLAGDFTMHPGPVGFGMREFAVTRWMAPTAGLATISGGFLPADAGATDVHVVLNGTAIFSAFRAGGTSVNFNLSQPIALGDTLEFVVGNAGDFAFDTTVLDATIVIPSPATLALGAGMLGFASRRKRR
jgi:hypothetical protein